MDKMGIVQLIGNEICEGCGPDTDCGIEPKECDRVINAVGFLKEYIECEESD